DAVALHRLEAREQVLEHARLDVVHAGHAVGGRRSFVEDPLRSGLGLVEGPLEDLALPPPGQDVPLHRGKVDLRGAGTQPAPPRRGRGLGRVGHFGCTSGVTNLYVETEGTRRRSPAVPPSLAAPGRRNDPLITVGCRIYWACWPFRRRLRGDQTAGHAPG